MCLLEQGLEKTHHLTSEACSGLGSYLAKKGGYGTRLVEAKYGMPSKVIQSAPKKMY